MGRDFQIHGFALDEVDWLCLAEKSGNGELFDLGGAGTMAEKVSCRIGANGDRHFEPAVLCSAPERSRVGLLPALAADGWLLLAVSAITRTRAAPYIS